MCIVFYTTVVITDDVTGPMQPQLQNKQLENSTNEVFLQMCITEYLNFRLKIVTDSLLLIIYIWVVDSI